MTANFLCPSCKGILNVGKSVILSTQTNEGKGGLVLLNPKIGNYSSSRHPQYKFNKGEQLEFFCPICHSKLDSEKHEKLAKVLVSVRGKESQIHFSKVAGEKSTYKVSEKGVESFGAQASLYKDLF